MAKAKIILLKIKVKKDKTSPVVLRLTEGKRRYYIFLGFSCKPGQWEDILGRFNPHYPKYKIHNSILQEKEDIAEKILDNFSQRKLEFSIDRFKKEFSIKKEKDLTVFSYFDRVCAELINNKKIGNANALKDAKNALFRYHSGNLQFVDITSQFLKKYKFWLQAQTNKQEKPLSDRTIHSYLRGLRNVFNRAKDDGLVSEDLNPFGRNDKSIFKGLTLKTRKRAITKKDILKIYNYKCEDGSKILDSKNYFIFSYLCGGINFVDMAYLTWDDIKNHRIEYKRIKTGKEYSIKINSNLQAILDHFKKYGSKYVFPILGKQHKTLQQERTRIKTASKENNSLLREIAEAVGIEEHLTHYVARHTMATVLYREENVPVSFIKETLGHSREEETQIYLDEISQEKKDELQDKLL